MVVDQDRFQEILDQVSERLAQANADGTLHDVLSLLGLQGLVGVDDELDLGEYDSAYGDLLVMGKCDAKKHVLQAVAEECGYSRERIKFVDYDNVSQFDCSILCNSMRYAAVLCGPVPHKAGVMGDTSSILEALRHVEQGYPPLAELRESYGTGELRITKTTFRTALAELEAKKAIRPNR